MNKIATAILITGSLAPSWCRPSGDSALGDRIAAYVESGRSPLHMSSLTDFMWERLHIFNPYTPWETVESEIDFPWPEGRAINLDQREDISLLVFVAGREVVRYVAQNRGRGDFAGLHTEGGYSREAAVFGIDHSQGWPRITIEDGTG